MSLTTIHQATEDEALTDRVVAAAQKEALNNPNVSEGQTARALRNNPGIAITLFAWPVAVDYETEYAYAVAEGNPNPGGDRAVITDENILAAVATHWPDESPPA